jgi:hypothetical protein
MKHLKYEFNSEAEFNELKLLIPHQITSDNPEPTYDVNGAEIIEGDYNTYFSFTSGDNIVQLGNVVTTEGVYNDDGSWASEPVYSDKWHVDILWLDSATEPDEFKPFGVSLDTIGVHGFAGVEYIII